MTELRIPPAAIRWTETFLEDRQAALAFDQQQEEMTPIETGIPQGSPASPVLFLLYLRPLFDTLQRNHPLNKCPSYIDDICLMTQGTTAETNSRTLEDMAMTCFEWGQKNAVLFDDSKSELMHY